MKYLLFFGDDNQSDFQEHKTESQITTDCMVESGRLQLIHTSYANRPSKRGLRSIHGSSD